MTSRIIFSEAAREDRRDITGYTVERFGIGQARRPRDRFQQVLTTLADNPQMGPSRTELDPPGGLKGNAVPWRQSLAPAPPHPRPFLAIEPVGPLGVDHKTLVAQEHMQARITVTPVPTGQILQPGSGRPIIVPLRDVMQDRPADADKPAGTSFAEPVLLSEIADRQTPRRGLQKFFDNRSFSAALSSIDSA